MDAGDPTNETTPLRRGSKDSSSIDPQVQSTRQPNPLPRNQLSIVLFVKACDALATQSIQPYINQLVGELDIVGGDQRKVGYYVGLLGTIYYAAFLVTVLHWNRLSDHIGRKPVLLIGMAGSAASMLMLGLSRTFWTLLASRALWGLLDGNVGVIKSVVGEITDSTNRAKGFALIFVLWAIGGSIGSIIGGNLAKPSQRFPAFFQSEFWKNYPYFLPSFTVSVIIASSFFATLFFFRETVPKKSSTFSDSDQAQETTPLLSSPDEPIPLRQLLASPNIVLAVTNYLSFEFLNTCFNSLLPLFLAMPVDIGGIGFDPARIGIVLGIYRAFAAFFTAVWFPGIVGRLGERRVFIIAVSSFAVLWMFFPMINLYAHHFGVSTGVWTGVILMMAPATCTYMAWACIFVFLTAAAPNKRSLGATNGLAQTIVSIADTIAPAVANSLFSFSVQRNLLGGYAVYAFFLVISCFAVVLALRLPHQTRPVWEEEEEEEEEEEVDSTNP